MINQEYLRRNLLHAKSIGVFSGLQTILDRFNAIKRKPKWLMNILLKEYDKALAVSKEMAEHTNEVYQLNNLCYNCVDEKKKHLPANQSSCIMCSRFYNDHCKTNLKEI